MKLRVTIVGLKCFDHLAGASTPRYLGGIETQLVVLARALAAAGCAVTLVCYNHGQPETSIDGIEVVNAFAPEAAVSPLGKLRAALTLRAAIRRTQPDVVLQMGAGAETGWTAWSCGTTPFVFCMASDANFGAHLRAGRFGLEGRIYRFGLRRARLIIAQTRRQHDGMLAALGLDSKIIGMAASPSPATASSSRQPASREILWIGRIIPGKRLEWLIEAAPHCPGLMFHVVGSPNRGSDYARNVMASAARLPNIKVHGRLNEAELGELYARVSFLCCTSQLEGFPTTFLEAWSAGLPVVTTFDPDGIVAENGLGLVANNVQELVNVLHKLSCNRAAWQRCSTAAVHYYSNHHAPDLVALKFLSEFKELLPVACPLNEKMVGSGASA